MLAGLSSEKGICKRLWHPIRP
jgi:hypothetical protein